MTETGLGCNHSGRKKNRRPERKDYTMETTPAIDFFNAHTVERGADVRDRTADTIIYVRSGEADVLL